MDTYDILSILSELEISSFSIDEAQRIVGVPSHCFIAVMDAVITCFPVEISLYGERMFSAGGWWFCGKQLEDL